MRLENGTAQGLLCDVCVPFAISGIWCSLNHMPLKSFCTPIASWRVRLHLTLQRRTRSSSVTGPREREPRGQRVVRDPLWSFSFHYHTVSCLLACYSNEVGRGDKDCWLIDRWYYSVVRFSDFTVFRKELHSSWLQYWNSFMNSIYKCCLKGQFTQKWKFMNYSPSSCSKPTRPSFIFRTETTQLPHSRARKVVRTLLK